MTLQVQRGGPPACCPPPNGEPPESRKWQTSINNYPPCYFIFFVQHMFMLVTNVRNSVQSSLSIKRENIS